MILGMVALLTAQTADPWVLAGRGDDFTDYVNTGSVVAAGDSRTMWQRRVWDTPAENGAADIVAQLRYDCRAKTFSMVSVSERRSDGSVIRTIEATPEEQAPNAVTPNSVGEVAMKLVCR